MRKKVLITLRHPGPTQSIMPALPFLCERYDVFVLITDSAVDFAYKRYRSQLKQADVFYYKNRKWILCTDELPLSCDSAEFSSVEEEGFFALVDSLADITRTICPDVVIRTTPAMKYGVDEAISSAIKQAAVKCRLLCYQEYYGCGRLLDSFDGTILTIDKDACDLLHRQGIDSHPIGWLSMLNFASVRHYNTIRKITRKKLQIEDDRIVVLYCATASGDVASESAIFNMFLSKLDGGDLYIKFHPRNSEDEKKRYVESLNDRPFTVVDNMNYEELLSFADYIVSSGSAINVDAIMYQLFDVANEFHTISVYTKGFYTDKIIAKATGSNTFILGAEGKGSLIVDESFDSFAFIKLRKNEIDDLFFDARRHFGGNFTEMIDLFLKYIEGEL